jgi:hypothetical protein
VHSRRVSFESRTAQSQSRPVLCELPSTMTSLHQLVAGRGSVDHVRDPGVPATNQSVNGAPRWSRNPDIITSQARSVKGRIQPPCSQPSGFGLASQSATFKLDSSIVLSRFSVELTGKLLLHILIELVAESIGTNQGTSFGITCV